MSIILSKKSAFMQCLTEIGIPYLSNQSVKITGFFRPDTDSESDEEGVAGPLGQLRGVEDSSDSDSDLMPQPRYKYGGRRCWSFGTAERSGGQL